MKFVLNNALELLERTPRVVDSLLQDISDDWSTGSPVEGSWSPYDIVGHLIHAEKTDWIPRMRIILSNGTDRKFEPFDRNAQFSESKGKSLRQLIDEFALVRDENIAILKKRHLTEGDLRKTGVHPEFGEVTLEQLLATWVVHDLNHLSQIARNMAMRYHAEVGPWKNYLSILNR